MEKIKRTIEVEYSPTWYEVAELFWSMTDQEMALFFNKLAEIEGYKFVMQLQFVTDHPKLNEKGRLVMELIGQYSNRERAKE